VVGHQHFQQADATTIIGKTVTNTAVQCVSNSALRITSVVSA